MSQKRKAKKSKSHHFVGVKKALTVLIISFLFIFTILVIAVVSYNLGFEEAEEQNAQALQEGKSERSILRNRLKNVLKESNEFPVANNTDPAQTRKYLKEPDYRALEKPKERFDTPPTVTTTYRKPKLAIIFDDVSYPYEVQAVKQLGIKVNFSFFPVTKTHPQTAFMAAKEPFYLVHLPLEAMHYNAEERKTLRVDDSLYTISSRLEAIKADFPKLKYLNNHTGSKFTSNEKAVEKLLYAASSLGLEIVDSRTTSKTKLPKVAAAMNTHLFQRDVFLDHESDVTYICGQIRQAVAIAKQKGEAIAIGHPRKHTIQALAKCKKKLSEVELVYLKDL